jgi:hypothetical protein
MARIADDKAQNTTLANDAYRAAFRLRFSGHDIPQDVWDSITETMAAIDRWFASKDKRAPEDLSTAAETT